MESMIIYTANVCRVIFLRRKDKKTRKFDSHERTFKKDRRMRLMGIKMTLVLVVGGERELCAINFCHCLIIILSSVCIGKTRVGTT